MLVWSLGYIREVTDIKPMGYGSGDLEHVFRYFTTLMSNHKGLDILRLLPLWMMAMYSFKVWASTVQCKEKPSIWSCIYPKKEPHLIHIEKVTGSNDDSNPLQDDLSTF